VRITSKGQVTIPQDIREKYGLQPNSEVDFLEIDGRVVVALARDRSESPGDEAVRRLSGSGELGMTTDEIMRLTRGDD